MTLTVIVTPCEDGCSEVRFSRYDATLVQTLKTIVARHDREWVPARGVWLVYGNVDTLIQQFTTLGVDTVTRHKPGPSPKGSDRWRTEAERWKKEAERHKANAERWKDLAHLFSRVDVAKSASGGDWASQLFAAVGASRADAVYKAVSRCLHPDTPTGDTELMQQLNTARDSHRRTSGAR